MIDRTSVTEDELHAYVDGELPDDRRTAVEQWLASHPDDAAQVLAWRAQAEAIRARYGGVIDEPVPDRLAIERLTRQRRSWAAIAAAAVLVAFFGGGAIGWMARGASAAAPDAAEILTRDALQAYRLYVVEVRHPVEVPGAERQHLVQWLSKRLDYPLRLPELGSTGLKLVGGRLLPGPAGRPVAFFMYEGSSGERYTLYAARSTVPQTAMRYTDRSPFAAVTWVDQHVSYVLSGPRNRDRLLSLAHTAYDQIDQKAAPKAG
jgi:anti-sigma factor RsiW